jgi:RNA methyltransferase, TrmH family
MITSSSNAKIKLVRSLQGRSRHRKAENAFIAEGVRLVEEAAEVGWPMEFALFDETLSERGLALVNRLKEKGDLDISQIPSALMAEISDTESPQGILAVLAHQQLPLPQPPSFLLIADQIRDPGNMGTLLRTAEAAGANGVLLAPGTVDAFSPKVVRAGMGAHFRLPVRDQSWEEIQSVVKDLPVFLAESGEGLPLWLADFQQPLALLIGGEAFGASPQGRSLATQKVTIPLPGRAESLNAAIAAGILIAEVLRQTHTE